VINHLYRCGGSIDLAISRFTLIDDFPKWQYKQIPSTASLRGTAIKQNSLWVTGSENSVFVSQDSGNTWQDKSVTTKINTDFRDIELFNSKTAIVMGIGSGNQSQLYKTINGGNSWQLLYQNTDEQGFFDSIAFWDENNGLLLGDPVDGYYVVKKTEDGGKTWRRVTKNNLPKILANESAFAASGNSLIVGKKGQAWLATGGFSASVYASKDYGDTWQRSSVPIYKETQTAGSYSLALNHLQQPFVIGGDYLQRPKTYPNMATLIDGKWQSVNSGNRGLRTAMSCQAKICLATGKTATDISFDAGSSWQAFNEHSNTVLTQKTKGFYTLASDNNVFLAARANGEIGILTFK
jgi:photosystem II stability/assembly factor-like uncharacterized protein